MLQHVLTLHSFLWRNNIHYIKAPHFTFHSLVHVHLGCFQFLTTMDNAAVNTQAQDSVLTSVFNSLVYMLGSRIDRSYGDSV